MVERALHRCCISLLYLLRLEMLAISVIDNNLPSSSLKRLPRWRRRIQIWAVTRLRIFLLKKADACLGWRPSRLMQRRDLETSL
ncbi:hypothetical protein BJ165DRAFT_1467489 [Panaeolus papilionaceus]|nr:hypothetical protein BJ165DRAFT_1467489 [Panaeolus papilionaceus]